MVSTTYSNNTDYAADNPAPRVPTVPAELASRDQWVGCKYGRRDGKSVKVPCDIETTETINHLDRANWRSFAHVQAAAGAGQVAGKGFVLAADDPFFIVDLDDCRDPETNELTAVAQAILEALNGTYAEVSVSGTGIHIIGIGPLPEGARNRTGNVEVYDKNRFVVITGRRLNDCPVADCSDKLLRWHADTFGPPREAQVQLVRRSPRMSDDEVLERLRRSRQQDEFERLQGGDWSGHASQSEADRRLCKLIGFYTQDYEQIDRLFRPSGLYRDKWEREDYRERTIDSALSALNDTYGSARDMEVSMGDDDTDEVPRGGRLAQGAERSESGRRTQAQMLVETVERRASLFHAPDGIAYADLRVDGHRETWRLRSRPFRDWLVREHYEDHRTTPNAQAVEDALRVLEGKARFDSPEEPVYLRIAEVDGCIYIDLCDDQWRAVEVTAEGWRVIAEPPVRFRRPDSARPLPLPQSGGSIEDLLRFVNVDTDDFKLLTAWLLSTFRGDGAGAKPVLNLQGEQGSAKSTTCRVCVALTAPRIAPIRALPGDERDLVVSAQKSWVLCFDNVSGLPLWASDALARLSTGGGLAPRTLYTDDEEMVFDAKRSIILNGIEDTATRADLLDRAILVRTPTIPEERRREEAGFWQEFEVARPRILGALLDAVSAGLRNLPTTRLDRLPRMADFAKWVTACETGLGWESGTFMRAYTRNRDDAASIAMEHSPIARHMLALVEREQHWEGTAGELLEAISQRATDAERRSRGFPTNARGMGGAARRVAPSLRAEGVECQFDIRAGTSSRQRLIKITRRSDGRVDGSEAENAAYRPTEALATPSDSDGMDDPDGSGPTLSTDIYPPYLAEREGFGGAGGGIDNPPVEPSRPSYTVQPNACPVCAQPPNGFGTPDCVGWHQTATAVA